MKVENKKPALLVLAAGMGSRYGGLKQVDGFGPNGETIIEYSIYDAIHAGFGKVVFVIRKEIEKDFRHKYTEKFDDQIEVQYAFQELDSPIEGIVDFPYREKPWGTGHAVLVAKQMIDEPFAVINGDDYYGPSAFRDMAKFLSKKAGPKDHSMIGYRLINSLSDFGTVNRGICKVDKNNLLVEIVETTKIHYDQGLIYHYNNESEQVFLESNMPVSMNFWGFHQDIFSTIHGDFLRFFKEHQDAPRAEFFIPLFVDQMIKKLEGVVHVIDSPDKWFGVTYQEDKPIVKDNIDKLIAKGVYPKNLWGG